MSDRIPRPWAIKVDNDTGETFIVDADGDILAKMTDKLPIPTGMGVARLLATAPDLYEITKLVHRGGVPGEEVAEAVAKVEGRRNIFHD